jgi:PAS domain S-box-containing protein
MRRLSSVLPKKFSTRLFLVTFIAGLIPVIIFAVLIDIYGSRIEKQITRIIEKGYDRDMAQSEVILREMGEASMFGKVSDIAQQLDMVIQTVPWMTVADLQKDEKFREVAVQTVGRTGYTFVFDSDTAIVRLHRDLRLENKNLPSVFRHLPELQNILETSLRGTGTAYGYYQLKAGDGNIMKRFIYIIPLHHTTADHARLSVAATINVDDFLTPARRDEANHKETKQFLIRASKAVIESFRHTGLISMGAGILAVSLIAFFVMGIYLSRAVSRLREATARVNRGDLSTPVKPSGSGDVATLIDDFNTMVGKLAATMVSKDLLQISEKKLKQANAELRREIADRERTEEALAAEKERLNITLRSIGDGVITADSKGRIGLINNAAEKLTGWLQNQAAGQHLSQVFRVVTEMPGAQGETEDMSAVSQQAPAPGLSQKLLLARDGTLRTIAETKSPIRDKGAGILGTIIVFRDISVEKRMEEEVLQARKLESLGVLAGGIAHDFNNLLAVILGNISFGKMFLKEEDSKVSERLIEAEKACMRGKELTYQLLAFARGGDPLRRTMAAAELIEDSVRSCLNGSDVKVSFSFPGDLPLLKVDEGQMRQVIQRIVKNADEAMGNKGVLEVKAEHATLGAANPLALKPGSYVRISLRDEGPGIEAPDLQRIFDPYFTKKDLGNEKGTGLGLSICYSIVKDHGGSITVESEQGLGSLFLIYLPAADQEGESLPHAPATAISPAPTTEEGEGRRGRLLFMDDDRGVRDVMVEILVHLGYHVRFAGDGLEAIEQYQEAASAGRPFDVVIADLTVPDGMGGKELIKELQSIDPKVKAIISSGYSNDSVLRDFREHGFQGCVLKPYKIEELCSVLDQVIQKQVES